MAIRSAAVAGGQMATADRIRSPGWWPTNGTAPLSDYAGAAACAPCHAAQSATQPTTAMARTAAPAERSEVARGIDRLKFSRGGYRYEIANDGKQSLYTVTDGDRSLSAPLSWAFGVGKVGQSFLFERDGTFHEARVSYYDSIGALDFTPARAAGAARDLEQAMSRPVGDAEIRRCFACHVTGPVANGVFDLSGATPGITCEACHGSARQHVDAMTERRIEEGRKHIVNPRNLDSADSVDFCGACHATFWEARRREGHRRAAVAAVSSVIEQMLERR